MTFQVENYVYAKEAPRKLKSVSLFQLLLKSELASIDELNDCLSMVRRTCLLLPELLVFNGIVSSRDMHNVIVAQSMLGTGRLTKDDAIATIKTASMNGMWLGEALEKRNKELERQLANFERELESMLPAA